MDKIRVGVLGCGVIANSTYLPGIGKMAKAELVAVCDIVGDRAPQAAAKWNVPKAYTDMDEFLADSDVQLVVNLTQIQAHFETNMAALQAGKHLYSEKTMTVTAEEATIVIKEAKKRGLKLGAAAATMLSPANVMVKNLIQSGAIGRLCYLTGRHSHFGAADFDGWTTDPTWFFKPGAGPMLDMGVYGLHSCTGIVGPAKKVACMSGISVPKRTVRSGPAKGQVIDVELDDNSQILMDFGNSTFGFLEATYCQKTAKGPRMSFFGDEGVITVNDYGDPHPISLFRDERKRLGYQGWTELDLPRGTTWGLPMGVEHLIDCILDPTKTIVTSGEHARHVIELINKSYQAAREGRTLDMETTF
jgi:predicted dehydrogenase